MDPPGSMQTAADLQLFLQQFGDNEDRLLQNGHIIRLCIDSGKDFMAVVRHIVRQCSTQGYENLQEKPLRTVVQSIFDTFMKKKKSMHRSSGAQNLAAFLRAQFKVPASRPPSSSCTSATATTQLMPTADSSASLVTAVSHVLPEDSTLNAALPLPLATSTPDTSLVAVSPPMKRLRQDCQNEVCSSWKQTLQKSHSLLQDKNRRLRQEKRDIVRCYAPRVVNQMKKRKDTTISELRARLRETRAANVKLRKKNEQLKAEVVVLKKPWTEMESKEIQRLKAEIKELEDALNFRVSSEEESLPIETRTNKKTYGVGIRKAVYFCLSNNVATDFARTVVEYTVSALTGAQFTKMPSPTTVAQMGQEMGVLADLQVTEAILDGGSCTIAWDATSISGEHINEVHFATASTTLTASIAALPGGRAEDYLQHINDTISTMATTYAAAHGLRADEVKNKISGSILCTLTDRASANRATVRMLEQQLQRQLLELHCHLHPLDGMTNEIRSALRKFNDTIRTTTYGQDCRAANLVFCISKMRYKATGDPSGFKAFLKQHNLTASTFPRYVGNRLHVLFHLAGMVHLHRDLLIMYFEKYCLNQSSLRTSILGDLKNPQIQDHLQALGIWGKLVTGPWMALFYTEDKKRGHFDVVPYLKYCMRKISRIASEPEFALTMREDTFGRPLIEDSCLKSLFVMPDDPVNLTSVIQVIAEAAMDVLKRQLARYTIGPLADPSQTTLKQAESAPLHNIWAERTLGILDAQARRAPNATITFLDSKVKVKMNHTLTWLDNKSAEEQTRLIAFSIKRACQVRKLGKTKTELKDNIQRERMKDKSQKRDMTQRNKLAKEVTKAMQGDQGADDPIFASLCDEQRGKLKMLLQSLSGNDKDIFGAPVQHLWSTATGDTWYLGKIQEVKKGKKGNVKLKVSYWKLEEAEEDAVDSTIAVEDFIADLILGDLIFIVDL